MVARFLRQSAEIREFAIAPHFPVSDNLKKDTGDWIEFCHARAYFLLCQEKFEEAESSFIKSKIKAKSQGDKYHLYLANLGILLCRLNGNKAENNYIDEESRLLRIEASCLGEGPHRNLQFFLEAGIAFRIGKSHEVLQQLKMIDRLGSLSYSQAICFNAWLATLNQESVRLHKETDLNILATYTRLFFAPS